MRRMLQSMLQALIEAEATAFIGAAPHERTDSRTTQRNGTRDELVTTGVGGLTVHIPNVRTGSFFPALLAPRRRIDVTLHAVVMQAYVEAVSTPRRRPGRGDGRNRYQLQRGHPDLDAARR